MLMSDDYSFEEFNLYNPAYVGIVIYQAIRECQGKNLTGMHCSLVYLIAPMAISPKFSNILPKTTATPIEGWAVEHEGELIGFASVVSSYVDIVHSAIAFLLNLGAITLSDSGFYSLSGESLPKKPGYVVNNQKLKRSFQAAGMLGRWFAEVSNVEGVFVHLGVRP